MPIFGVNTPQRSYSAFVERGAIERLSSVLPAKAGQIFVVTESAVWQQHGQRVVDALGGRSYHVLHFPGGEHRKRMAEVEALAEQMVAAGGDRSSIVIAFGGGIVNDLGGFLAAIFMRGVPVIQIPTTLLAQVDAAVGGKTGANLESGKNLVGAFHQPLAVLVDPEVLSTLPDREFRAGLFEVLKCGVIASQPLFEAMASRADAVLGRDPALIDFLIAESVRIKAEVVTADEREGDLRRILNFGHTLGHALEAETGYSYYLHGEAVAFGMSAATRLSRLAGLLAESDEASVATAIRAYGPIPAVPASITPDALVKKTYSDKKTIQGSVHWVLADRIGHVVVRSGVSDELAREAAAAAIAEWR